ncbi:hypothetical protein D3H55_20515 [Bacillus salacetis]|uniref:Uncharacterized protein n=1 Tax=Bacillus salacetis TaxID=2315464 RepID=A0A3A1QRR2_9BACI|nr:hypothetical protein [Bacillus salacetis]RIW28951.1 hypothetical protein D3H55_20515 [Bacillus salacetis]
MIYKILSLVLTAGILVGCNHNGSPAPSDYLKSEGADIFMLDGYVYSNVQRLEWVKETEYSLGEQIGEITKQTTNSFGFDDGDANILPVGTKIYETDSPITIAVVDGKEIAYMKQVEG